LKSSNSLVYMALPSDYYIYGSSILLAFGLTQFFSHYRSNSRFLSRYKNSTIVITGASQGVGAHIARTLAKLLPSSKLVLLARTESLLAELAKELRQNRPGEVLYYTCDCSKSADLLAVAEKLGTSSCDIVISNAGVGTWKAIYEDEATPIETERCLSAPLLSTLHTAHAFLPGMIQFKSKVGGVFLCVQSPASRIAWPGATAYTAARWGLRGICASLAVELPSHIKVSEVVLSEIKDSEYFNNNPGSYERLPWIAPLFGSLTSQGAANAVVSALKHESREYVAPWQLRIGLAFLWVPGVSSLVSALVKATGWKFKVLNN